MKGWTPRCQRKEAEGLGGLLTVPFVQVGQKDGVQRAHLDQQTPFSGGWDSDPFVLLENVASPASPVF